MLASGASSAVLVLLLSSSGAFGQSANVSSGVPTYSSGSQGLSQNLTGGLRTQPQANGVDVTTAAPLPVTMPPGTPGSVVIDPTAAAGFANPYVVTASAASSKVLKGAPGNLYGFQVTTGATSGVAMLFDATSAPVDGAVTPVKCYQIPANSSIAASWSPGPPLLLATGITVVFSSGTNCFSKTASATAFISGEVQ